MKNKGITLIALVITIVVLIILAAVAINLSLGNNGIFNRAKTAKEKYQNSDEYEQTELIKTTNQIDSYVNSNRNYEDEINQLKATIEELENPTVETLSIDGITYNSSYIDASNSSIIIKKCGKMVSFSFSIKFKANMANTGDMLISGLPCNSLAYSYFIGRDGGAGKVEYVIKDDGKIYSGWMGKTITSGMILQGSYTYITSD